jgi:hypothetical protein
MSKRAGPPLFELLRKQSEDAPAAVSSAPPRRDSDPSVPWTGAGVTRAERSAATLEDEPRSTGELRIPMTRVYLAIALMLFLVVAAWAAGHYFGVQAGRAEMSRAVGDEPVVPPLGTDGTASAGQPARTPAPIRQPQTNTGSQPAGSPATSPGQGVRAPAPGMPWVLAAGGLRASDPRTPGSNYLQLATLPPDQTQEAIEFLASKGVRSIGVPVDSGPGAANNPSRYTLVSLGLAVPSGQYSSTLSQRRDHERLVATIGAEWKRDRRGGSDFSQTQWSRYDP